MKLNLWICALLMLLAVGCEKKVTMEVPTQKPAQPSGREETKNLENVKPLGYDTTQVRTKLDAALDQNDKRTENLDKQVDQAGQ